MPYLGILLNSTKSNWIHCHTPRPYEQKGKDGKRQVHCHVLTWKVYISRAVAVKLVLAYERGANPFHSSLGKLAFCISSQALGWGGHIPLFLLSVLSALSFLRLALSFLLKIVYSRSQDENRL